MLHLVAMHSICLRNFFVCAHSRMKVHCRCLGICQLLSLANQTLNRAEFVLSGTCVLFSRRRVKVLKGAESNCETKQFEFAMNTHIVLKSQFSYISSTGRMLPVNILTSQSVSSRSSQFTIKAHMQIAPSMEELTFYHRLQPKVHILPPSYGSGKAAINSYDKLCQFFLVIAKRAWKDWESVGNTFIQTILQAS